MAFRLLSSPAKRSLLASRAERSASNEARWVGSMRTLCAMERSWKSEAAAGLSGFCAEQAGGESAGRKRVRGHNE